MTEILPEARDVGMLHARVSIIPKSSRGRTFKHLITGPSLERKAFAERFAEALLQLSLLVSAHRRIDHAGEFLIVLGLAKESGESLSFEPFEIDILGEPGRKNDLQLGGDPPEGGDCTVQLLAQGHAASFALMG